MSSDEAFVLTVLASLKAARLEALVVGNVAAILQGAPVTTQDIDLLVRDTARNREKIATLGALLGGQPRSISLLTSALRIDAPQGTVDIIFDALPGDLRFESLRARAVEVPLGSVSALVANLADVIASKEAAARPKDLAQLPILRDTLRVKAVLGES